MPSEKPIVEVEIRVDGTEVASVGFFASPSGDVVTAVTALRDTDTKQAIAEALHMASEAFRFSDFGSGTSEGNSEPSFFHD